MLQGVANLEEAKRNVLGGEVALWTEQADAFSVMSACEARGCKPSLGLVIAESFFALMVSEVL